MKMRRIVPILILVLVLSPAGVIAA